MSICTEISKMLFGTGTVQIDKRILTSILKTKIDPNINNDI